MNSLLSLSTVVDVVGSGGTGETAAASTGMNPIMLIILYCVVIFGAMYFFSIRPQKKRQAKMDELRSGIQVGDSVLLANGLFGKVVDVTAECYVVEFGTNKGVRIPVLKQEVYAKREPNLTNKVEEVPVPEKKSLFGRKKDDSTEDKI